MPANSAINRDFKLYALPYAGNAQALITSLRDPLPLQSQSWPSLSDKLKLSKSAYYSRLDSNNTALADFLPILLAAGGCLVGKDGNREVSGFSGPEGHAAAKWALQLSKDLAEPSPVQYTRLNDEDVHRYLAGSDNAIGVSWLGDRVQTNKKSSLRWFVMPDRDSKSEVSLLCKAEEERVAHGVNQRPGTFSLWSLAVRESENSHLGWEFVSWALGELRGSEITDKAEQCADSRELKDTPDAPSPFEDQLTCGVRNLIRHSRPRMGHPNWGGIEAAVGLRIREAHWGTKEIDEAVNLASQDIEKILDEQRSIK
jgi:hypothetical protein